MAHARNTCHCRVVLGTTVNPDTIGCAWTGEFDLNTLRVDGEIFESRKKKLRIQKYPDTCGRGLRKYGEICSRYVNVSGNMFLCFIETDRRKNSLRKAPAKIESNLES